MKFGLLVDAGFNIGLALAAGLPMEKRMTSSAAFSPLNASNIHLVCHRKFRTTLSRIQAPGKTNDREDIVERILQHFSNQFRIILHFLMLPIQCR